MKAASRDRQRLARHFTQANPLRIEIVTLSDRASSGEYEDKSGPRIASHFDDFFADSGVSYAIERCLLSDDPEGLSAHLQQVCDAGVHIIVTTGGTGVGPRDNTPEVLLGLADKTIPGIMEAVRMKYGIDKPKALLSRSVAVTIGPTVAYTLPGSTKAVDEYMSEILRSLEHIVCLLQDLAPDG